MDVDVRITKITSGVAVALPLAIAKAIAHGFMALAGKKNGANLKNMPMDKEEVLWFVLNVHVGFANMDAT